MNDTSGCVRMCSVLTSKYIILFKMKKKPFYIKNKKKKGLNVEIRAEYDMI